MRLRTERLELIAQTLDMARAEGEGPLALAAQLGVPVPDTWPPDLYDEDARRYNLDLLSEDPNRAGWQMWYITLREPQTLIGIIGFKGAPGDDGSVEVGYSVLAEYQRAGYATEAVRALANWAFAQNGVTRVLAETYPHLIASIRVLEKNGFHFIGDGSEPGVIRFELLKGD